MGKGLARLVLLVLVGFAALAGYEAWERRRADAERRRAELEAGRRASEILTASFAGQASLRVARLSGAVRSQGTCLSANFIANGQQTIAPYSVNYFVDLAGIDRSNYRWDGADRVMFVDAPGVTTEPPRIDMAQARTAQTGLFVSRACGQAMQRQVAGRLAAPAAD